ncbi:putative 8-amino-7-oxononanoatesynthase [Kockovaella imperatae]|uniref:Putative 8-amino-7-oxononanoatesynthase n=1 Tax=Kockovaella imperatae TaxID=4999 RepID=A0A1Y1UFB1_9TREE|nr:putative 8-amino-7-oxononanoatesynthase [Kockovaella imperatae]ORX36702.1 putative 8-amino-7-oxononanoatesynthase [Kockovaella imperatae]
MSGNSSHSGSSLDHRLTGILDDRKSKKRYRSLKVFDDHKSGLVDFSSNDYLSLTASAELRANFVARIAKAPLFLGSTGSRLLSGASPSHSALEQRFADFFHAPSALLFNSGWDANVSFFSTIPQPGDWVVFDELVHASVHSGLRASRVHPDHRIAFDHNDSESLGKVLDRISSSPAASSHKGPVVFLALESLYSMDGDMAPLQTFLDVLDKYVPRSRQCIVLDEAHSTGVYGPRGRGVAYALGEEGGWEEPNMSQGAGRIGVRLMTFGKAVGCSGAVLLCSPTIRSFLINFARPFIFSTALPHSSLHALEAAFDIIQSKDGETRRQKLFALCRHLHAQLDALLETCPRNLLRLPPRPPSVSNPGSENADMSSITPIIGLITPNPHALSAFLLEKGFIVRPVVPPTVPPGSERIRLCLRSDIPHSVVDDLSAALKEWINQKQGSERYGSIVGSSVFAKAKL